MYKKILLAADGSENAVRSARHALGIRAGHKDSHIDIIYVIDGEKAKSEVIHFGDTAVIEKKRKERLKPIIEMFEEENVSYDIHLKHGEPGPSIVEFANEGNYDCVVIGSRGLNKLQSMVLGSVSHKVAKRVQSPVMIVK
ncbi:universal stress protein [Bacillus sp. FJAT-44742]|uniref:universal stress protein n=1 Tax=Bacillus sp. FJAT-44742 TaxID=2014005 RepID=UPI000C24047C|nr:universal stress protein [Bacillus sp. FJAT-44742]